MTQKAIDNIEEKLSINNSLTEKNTDELLELLEKLKPEITKLSEAKIEQVKIIGILIEHSTQELLRRENNSTLIKSVVNDLSAAIKGFEEEHPQLVENVNYIATALSNMGI